MAGLHGFGMKLRRGGTAGTAIANITRIRGMDIDSDIVDVSAHDSPSRYRVKVKGMIDAGQVTFDYNYDPAQETHKNAVGGLRDDLESPDAITYAIEYPTSPAAFDVFSAFVKSLSPEMPFDDKISGTATLAVTGAPTLA